MKLVISKDIVIPEPLTLKSGWIGEVKGVKIGRQSSIRTIQTNINKGRRADTFHASLSRKFIIMS